MKIKGIGVIILVLVLSTILIGCGGKEKEDEIINSSEQTREVEVVVDDSTDIKDQAKKEGVSVKALQKTLDGLAELGADKYGITKEEYIDQTKANGHTVLSEWQLASENMGISITEIYQYEKARGDTLTDEQKETMQGMGNALKLAEVELENISAIESIAIEEILGIEGNKTGEIRVVTLSDEALKEAMEYKVYKVTQDYKDDYSIGFDYVSDADIEVLSEYFKALVLNTEGYSKLGTPDNKVVMYQGKINETDIYIEIDGVNGGMPTIGIYFDISSKK